MNLHHESAEPDFDKMLELLEAREARAQRAAAIADSNARFAASEEYAKIGERKIEKVDDFIRDALRQDDFDRFAEETSNQSHLLKRVAARLVGRTLE